MNTQLLGVSTNAVLQHIAYQGLQGFCTGWASSRGGTVYASLIGRVTAVNGIWAAFLSGATLRLDDGEALYRQPKLEGATYHTLRTRLPETDWLHLVLLHSQATMHNLPDADFYILSGIPEPPLDAFWMQWNNALPLPARQEWVSRMWEKGTQESLIGPVSAEGTHCWSVEADVEAWSTIIQTIVKEEQP